MGSGRFDHHDWKTYTGSKSYDYTTASHTQIYTQTQVAAALDPKHIALRESRDSADNPASTPLIVALDVTGSMHAVLESMAKEGLPRLMNEVYGHEPIPDPHVCTMAIGDCECDRGPLQVTQFEADVRIAQQLEQLWLEGGGGGNRHESYALAWYFAQHHVVTDAWEKRGQKGYLFTVGDEEPTPHFDADDLRRVFGHAPKAPYQPEALLKAVQERWEVFHLIVGQGDYATRHKEQVRQAWADVLGQRAVWLKDHTKMAQAIVVLLLQAQGKDVKQTVAGWDAHTGDVIRAMDLAGVA
jgi:hypothetical protein